MNFSGQKRNLALTTKNAVAVVNGMDGYMAVLLWQRYQRGDKGALDLLLSYNREDVVNLEVLMDGAFAMERERLFPADQGQSGRRQAARP